MTDSEWDAFRRRYESARGQLEAFKNLWWHGDDVSILGALGGREFGWAEVGPRLDYAFRQVQATDLRIENVVTLVGNDVAYTVDFEHMERTVGSETRHRVLRCTQIYRRIAGEWRILHRHADDLFDRLPPVEGPPGPAPAG